MPQTERRARTSCGSRDAGARQDDNALRLAIFDVLGDGIKRPRRQGLRGDLVVDEAGLFLTHFAALPARERASAFVPIATPSTYVGEIVDAVPAAFEGVRCGLGRWWQEVVS